VNLVSFSLLAARCSEWRGFGSVILC